MKSVILAIALMCASAWGDTSIRCRQHPEGIYPNSAKFIQTLDLVSYVNHFSLANMMAMQIDTDSGEINFGRQSIEVTTTTNIKMVQKTNGNRFRIAWLLIDRTPRVALTTRFFKGVLFISEPQRNHAAFPSELPVGSVTTLNFECSI